MRIGWQELGETLYALAADDVRRFGHENGSCVVYGFAFDCNATYGHVLLCVNTKEALDEQTHHYQVEYSDLYEGQDIDAIRDELRWSLGDWEFQGFNSDTFDAAWAPFKRSIRDAAFDDSQPEDVEERFMETVCGVLLRMERDGVFDALQKTEDFRVFLSDHDCDEKDGWKRIQSAREAM